MKKIFNLLLLFPLLFSACDNEEIEMFPPYIFFTYDVDEYVLNQANTDASSFTITGSISAQGLFEEFQIADILIGKDSIGDDPNWQFEYTVDLKGKTGAFDIPFRLTDRMGNTVTKSFRFLTSGPIETYKVTMGAQSSSNYGFFFSFKDKKVYSVAEFENMKDEEGLCFGYDTNKKQMLLLSPTELINKTVLTTFKGTKICSFCEIVAIDNVAFDKTQFDKVENDAFLRNLNPVEFGTFPSTLVEDDKTYLFKSEDDSLRGIAYVQSLQQGIGGQIELIIKMQKQ